ncbi:helix-turn-helix domain-containing protein [Dyella sp. KRB-257]|uniref:helix-turn-helix domain-containing protein n=1 Tax=Dyella sp. KRB-257 TaxID=3400915 RepID=UPI003C00DD84
MPLSPVRVVLDMANFAERPRTLRSQRNINQTRFAELLGVSPRVYNRWETGDAVPHFDTVVRIAQALDVSLDTLAGRTEPADHGLLRNPELHQLYRQVDELPDEDQQALILVIDRLIKSSRVSRAVGATPARRPRSHPRAQARS